MFVPIDNEDQARLMVAEFIGQSLVNGQFTEFLRHGGISEVNLKDIEVHALRCAQELHARPYNFQQESVVSEPKASPLNKVEQAMVIDGNRIQAMEAMRARTFLQNGKALSIQEAKEAVDAFEQQLDNE